MTMTTDATNAGKCTACYPNYKLTNAKTCKMCDEVTNCVTCTVPATGTDDTLTCTACKDNMQGTYGSPATNFYVNSGACSSCSETGCLKCAAGTCSACQYGYNHDATGNTCAECTVTNCMTCTSGTDKCDVCWSGYRVWTNPAGTSVECETCVANCAKCESKRETCT